jgi:hypothetical protein
MGWADLLSTGVQANQALANYGQAPAQAPQETGGVGPWAAQQGAVPGTFLERYLKHGTVFAKMPAKKPEPAPAPEVRMKTSPVAQALLGDRGNKQEGAAADSLLSIGAQTASVLASASDATTAASAGSSGLSGGSAALGELGGWPAAIILQIVKTGMGVSSARKHRLPGESKGEASARGVFQSDALAQVSPSLVKGQTKAAQETDPIAAALLLRTSNLLGVATGLK